MSFSRCPPLAFALWLAFLPGARAQDNAATFPPGFVVAMDVAIAPDGRIVRVQPDADVADPVRQALLRRVPEWRYAPPAWEGRQVELTRRLALRLQFAPVKGGGGYALRVAGQAFDPGIRAAAPRYPQRALRRGVGGQFSYRVTLGAAGAPTRATLISPSPTDDPIMAELEAAARETLESWRWPVPLVDGHPVACDLLVPIRFTPRQDDAPESAPSQPPPQVSAETWPQGDPDSAPLCPSPELQTPIAGALL